jgi:hypothetical protein
VKTNVEALASRVLDLIEPKLLLVVAFALACARDETITRGADGADDWKRRAEAAIPLGISIDSARAVLVRNGFNCRPLESADSTVWCDKVSGGRFEMVRRRWQTILHFQSGRVKKIESSTGLIGL